MKNSNGQSKLTPKRALSIIERIMGLNTYSSDNKIECISEVIKHIKREDDVEYAKGFFNAHKPTFIKLINTKEEEIEFDNTLVDDDFFMDGYARLFNRVAIKDGFVMKLYDPEDEEEFLVLDKVGE